MQRLFEAGIVMKLTNDEVSNYKMCQNPESKQVEIGALKLVDFFGVFLLYIGGENYLLRRLRFIAIQLLAT